MKKTDIIQALHLFKEENQTKYGIRSIGIFGSAGRDSLNEHSDIDVVVELEDHDLSNLIGINQISKSALIARLMSSDTETE